MLAASPALVPDATVGQLFAIDAAFQEGHTGTESGWPRTPPSSGTMSRPLGDREPGVFFHAPSEDQLLIPAEDATVIDEDDGPETLHANEPEETLDASEGFFF